MYIDWAHRYIPRICAVAAYVVNPIFIYIIFKDTKLNLQSYKYLLLYFSIFNMSCSLCDVFVPVCIFDYRYAFTIFVVEGYFDTQSELGRYLLAFRCSYITGIYAILHAHFAYRYLILAQEKRLKAYFIPYGLTFSVFYCAGHMALWTFIGGFLSGGNHPERLSYVQEPMKEYFGFDVRTMNIIIAQYNEADEEFINESWVGIGSLSLISLASLTLLLTLGFLTNYELLKKAAFMSGNTRRQQTQLIRALFVQTVTPTVVSFFPCIFSWYQPVFGIHGARWLQQASGIALSTFPVVDPLAIIFFLPTFRRRFKELIRYQVKRRRARRTSIVQNICSSEMHRTV